MVLSHRSPSIAEAARGGRRNGGRLGDRAKMNGSGDGSVRSQQLLIPYEPAGVDAQVRLLFLACYPNANMELSNASVGKLTSFCQLVRTGAPAAAAGL